MTDRRPERVEEARSTCLRQRLACAVVHHRIQAEVGDDDGAQRGQRRGESRESRYGYAARQ